MSFKGMVKGKPSVYDVCCTSKSTFEIMKVTLLHKEFMKYLQILPNKKQNYKQETSCAKFMTSCSQCYPEGRTPARGAA